ncbi:serpin family protein [Myxococcota bacterium]|nr:serpin family protein [Myxococcota bacterium]
MTRPLSPLLVLGGLVAACGTSSDPLETPPPGEVQRSSLTRNTSPSLTDDAKKSLVTGNTDFALDFHRAARDPGANLFYSPFSISSALAMTYAGARGQTEAEIADALHFTLPQADLHSGFNWLDLELSSRGQGAQGADGKPFRLRNVNAVFGQIGYPFLSTYLDVLALNYGAGVSMLDFVEHTEESRLKINGWVEGATEGRIPELLAQGVVDASTRLVLVNAIYFNAGWKTQFDEDLTSDEDFETPSGTERVPTMHATETFGYFEDTDAFAVSLPYDGGELDMIVIVPNGDLAAYEDSLDAAKLDALVASISDESLELSMPKFELRWKDSLVSILSGLGMRSAFDDADFSGIDGTRSLQISDVIHEAFVKVNENGTEAAAATAVVIRETSVPVGRPVAIDRPFLFFIRDRATATITFGGRITDPTP